MQTVGTRDLSNSGPRVPRRAGRRAFAGPDVRLPGSCRAQHERPNAKGIGILPGSMLGPDMNAGIDAGTRPKDVRYRFRAEPGFGGKFSISNA